MNRASARSLRVMGALAAVICLFVAASPATAEMVEFRYRGNASQVFLAGEFNNWNPTGTPLKKDGGDWVVEIDLPAGEYQYKFVADGQWVADPNAKKTADDGFGGQNSVVAVGGGGAGGFVSGASEGGTGAAASGSASASGSGSAPQSAAVAPGAVTIEWAPGTNYQQVFVAGEFNDWNTSATPMKKSGGKWTATLDLAEGRYQYKFVADGNWLVDPNAAEKADDGFGGENGVLVVGAGGAAAPATAAPASGGGAAAAAAGEVTFSFTPEKNYGSVALAGEFNDWSESAHPMTKSGDTWSVSVPLAAGRYQYKFVADGSWIADPNAAELIDDGFGGENSVLTVSGSGAAGVTSAPAPTGPVQDVTFTYQPMISGVSSIHLVGEFNGWDTAATPMLDPEGDGVYEVTIPLAPGTYPYKFLVDGTNWLEDPNAEDTVEDGFGGNNSLRTVGQESSSSGKPRNVEFRWDVGGAANEVWLAGTFNQWATGHTAMTDADGDGVYAVTLLLPEGEYQYKFVVDGNWVHNPEGDFFVDDGFGGQNTGIVVDDRFPAIELALGDGKVYTDGLTHTQSIGEVNRTSASTVEFTTRTYNEDVERVALAVRRGGDVTRHPMKTIAQDATFEWRRVEVELPRGTEAEYWFEMADGDEAFTLCAAGFSAGGAQDGFDFSDDVIVEFTTPDWVRDGVFYQIFPERFANGDKSNDPDFSEFYYEGMTTLPASGKKNGEYYHLVEDWYDTAGLAKSPYRTDGKPDYFSFYGGDIAGLHQNLDYLEDLGVSVLYFNPLFEARSNHKYEAVSYRGIDPSFGTPEEFRAFVDDCHGRGIHVVVDWVINHIGNMSPEFLDTVEKGQKSEYWDWFEWKKWPLPAFEPQDWTQYYSCWWGFHHMPDLNFDLSRNQVDEHHVHDEAQATPNEPLIDMVLDAAEWWLDDMDIDGFRLDVANEVPFWVWERFRERCRSVKSDCYLVGEIWGDAGDWIGPDCFDAVMNYKYFKDPVSSFLGAGRGNATRFDRELAAGRMAYPAQATRVMMNLVGSHDTPRVLTAIGGDERRLKLMALFQMTYIGAPHIYYGDEIAMKGGADPDCRRTFRWNWEGDADRKAMHGWYRDLIHLRRDHSALITGDYETVFAEGGVHAFARTNADDRFLVVMNASEREMEVELPVAELGTSFSAAIGGSGDLSASGGTLKVKLPPVSGQVLRVTSSS